MPVPRTVTFGPQVCGSLTDGATNEWLVTDGLGGFAMGTVAGLRTRRYHGLLVTSDGSAGAFGRRHVGLAALDPVLRLPSGAEIRLGIHEWSSGSVSPVGNAYLEAFELRDGLPLWRFRVGEVVLRRELAMVYGRPGVGVVYTLLAGGPVTLAVDALCTWRDAHGERRSDGRPMPVEHVPDGAVIDGGYRIAGPGWQPGGAWYLGAHLREEANRGLDADEDLWYAGSFTADLSTGDRLEVSAWAGDLDDPPPPASVVVSAARTRAAEIVTAAKPADDVAATLVLAADAFVVRGGAGTDVIAGYPWFGAWSRDTMTSYEGLFLATNRADEGRDLLRSYAATLDGGMLANTADTGSLEYNTTDATMWLLHAIGRHVERAGDDDLAAELLPRMLDIVAAHRRGVRFGIHVDTDGLLTGGADGVALTWMDARTNGVVITPRGGKPVEVNALWVSGLATIAAVGGRIGTDISDISVLHDQARTSFQQRFQQKLGTGDLFDTIDPADPAIRPNQLLAWSLPYGPMRGTPPPGVGELLTPLGLRSLSPADPAYRGRHRGDQTERDLAYHQGTVWPWLIGPYVDATGAPPEVLDGLTAHLAEYGLGSVSETAEGDPPHAATGCPFQAWSVAEFLRLKSSCG